MNGDDHNPKLPAENQPPAEQAAPVAPPAAPAAPAPETPGTPPAKEADSAAPSPAPSGSFFHAEDTSDSDKPEPAAAAAGPESAASQLPAKKPAPRTMQWTADGLHHDPQSGARMVVVFIIVVVVAALVYLLTKSPFSAGAIAVIGLLFGIIGSKRPQALDYRIDTTGIMIGQKRYSYSQFRSFAIIDEGGYTSIALMPLKRFLPMLSVFYDPQIQSEVVEALSAHLPLEDHKRDLIDQLTSIIKL